MYALIFTNTILGAYLVYIIAEKRKKSLKNSSFWAVFFLLTISLAITVFSIVPLESIDSVKETMLP